VFVWISIGIQLADRSGGFQTSASVRRRGTVSPSGIESPRLATVEAGTEVIERQNTNRSPGAVRSDCLQRHEENAEYNQPTGGHEVTLDTGASGFPFARCFGVLYD
jgi:hypothetical protein